MSRWDLVIGTCVALAAGTASAAPAHLTITATDVRSDESLRAGNAALISHELGVKLATANCDGCHLDASIARLDVETTDAGITVTAEIDIAISDARGVMISVLAGGARATSTPHGVRLAALRDEALTAAVDGMCTKVAGALHPRYLETWVAAMLRTWLVRDVPTS